MQAEIIYCIARLSYFFGRGESIICNIIYPQHVGWEQPNILGGLLTKRAEEYTLHFEPYALFAFIVQHRMFNLPEGFFPQKNEEGEDLPLEPGYRVQTKKGEAGCMDKLFDSLSSPEEQGSTSGNADSEDAKTAPAKDSSAHGNVDSETAQENKDAADNFFSNSKRIRITSAFRFE